MPLVSMAAICLLDKATAAAVLRCPAVQDAGSPLLLSSTGDSAALETLLSFNVNSYNPQNG